MEFITKFIQLYPRLLDIVATDNDFTLLIAFMFIIALIVNIICYFFWGRY